MKDYEILIVRHDDTHVYDFLVVDSSSGEKIARVRASADFLAQASGGITLNFPEGRNDEQED